jgi:hypothetical protein
MAYENTEVPVSRSQEAIRKLIMTHGGYGLAVVSDRENGAQEGFHAKVLIDQKPYTIRIMASLKEPSGRLTPRQKEDFTQREERRIWRVLFYHLKSVFEAADSGVMEFRELILPYIVIGERTVAEHILPRIDAAIANPNRLLSD